jgi:protein-disulfide isomerase
MELLAVDRDGKPACPICIGLHKDSGVPVEVDIPNKAHCSYCKVEAVYDEKTKLWTIGKSTETYKELPFYNSKTNTFYCGCRGWD